MSYAQSIHPATSIYSKQPWFVLGAAREFSLQPANDDGVSHFYSFEFGALAHSTLAIPDGCVDIMFDCDDSMPRAFVYGTPFQATQTLFTPGHRYFGVRFLPGLIPAFIKGGARELVGQSLDFLDMVPGATGILEQIVRQPTFAKRVASFKTLFRPDSLRRPTQLTSAAISMICQRRGNVHISDLAAQTGYSCRTLQRQFLAEVGMSPKTFCRIIRFQSCIYEINHSASLTFSDLACDLGFSDQAHFLREFKTLTSITPYDYLRRVRKTAYLQRIRPD